MHSLKEVFGAMQAQDHEKLAQAEAVQQYGPGFAEVDPGLLKQAQDYDYIGRVLAHNVFSDMVKEAMEEAMPGASEDDKKKEVAKILAKATGQGGEDDEDEDDDEDDEGEDEGEESEKKAAVQAQILQRMAEDPEYVSYLVSKHYG